MKSPCVQHCKIDEHGYCRGCSRTLTEIARWSRMTDGERLAVLKRIGEVKK